MDVAPPRGNGRMSLKLKRRMAVLGAAWLIFAVRFLLPVDDYLQALMTGSVKPLLDFITLMCNYGLTAVMVDAMLPAFPVSGELVAMLLAACLAGLNVLEARMVVSLVVAVGTWRLLWFLARAHVLPRARAAIHPAVQPNDGYGPLEVLEQLGEVKRVTVLTDATTSATYLWLNRSPEAANDSDPVDARYLLQLKPENSDACGISLEFIRDNRTITWYTGIQTLAIKLGRGAWWTEILGLKAESLKRLQDALAAALIQKQCSDQPTSRITVINTGLEILKLSAQVITIGVVDNGFLVVRREDLQFNTTMTEVLAIRAIYFVEGNNTIGDLLPPAAFVELGRFQDSLQRLIYVNVLWPFLEYTANPPAV